MKNLVWVVVLVAVSSCLTPAAESTRLLRQPDVSRDRIVFAHGGDLWIVPLSGGAARRLTSFPGVESEPHFSPGGDWVAFTGQYDGNTDVYVVPVGGGEPRRLTYHPGADFCRGFSLDGRSVLFASGRTGAPIPYPKFWSVPLDGGFPTALAMPRAWYGEFSPDGTQFAYQAVQHWETEFRNYRGGQNKPIWILKLSDLSLKKVPWDGAGDSQPVWMGHSIYFLSDRDFAMNVWVYDTDSGKVRQLTHFKTYDAKELNGGDGMLVFEQAGAIHLLNPQTGSESLVPITVRGDFPWARPHWEDVSKLMSHASLSPTGKRALFEARGDIFTVPAEKGDVRDLTATSGVAERAPAWSPDGGRIAWFSDRGGEYRLIIADQMGHDRKEIRLEHPTFYYTPAWSPDSMWISFADANRVLWVVNAGTDEVRRIDDEGFANPNRTIYPEWSPDSKWIAYTRRLSNQYNVIRVYSMETEEIHDITDGLSDSVAPAWDRGGKYLSFLASTDFGLNVGWLDMTSYDHPVTRALYMAVLAADEPSPLHPLSDDENSDVEDDSGKTGSTDSAHGTGASKEKSGKTARAKHKRTGASDAKSGKQKEKKPPEVRIDFKGLGQRIISLDLPARNYRTLRAGAAGTLFYTEVIPNEKGATLHRYTLKDRKSKQVASGVTGYALSADGKKLLVGRQGPQWSIIKADESSGKDDGVLNLSDMRMKVDPRAEWKQIFREAWRYERDYFYVQNHHGLDLQEVYRKYAGWLDDVRHRSDLTHVLDILGGELSVGHSFTGGGDNPDVEKVPVGLLGVDLVVDQGRYRIHRIFTGENWNPELRSPLSGPGLMVKEGDYLLAVNGEELKAGTNPYGLFDRTADRQTVLTLNQRPVMKGSREITVRPVKSESGLRRRAWVEGNRRLVGKLSGGKLAYVWLPNTGQGGYKAFNRYYFAQQDKQGVVVDERFNQGGSIADYMIDLMGRGLMGYFNNPLGEKQPFTAPNGGIWGPKVMLINDAAGSGGDMLPYMFRLKKIGPLVGTRTWGGLVGIWDVPPLVDGGFITAPRGGFFDLNGEWAVENQGVAPDIQVEQLPAQVVGGHDPQLEKGVAVALELLKKHPVRLKTQPPDPVRVKHPR